MLKGLKGRMGPKGIRVVTLSIWAGLIVWMLLYLAWAVSTAQFLGAQVYTFAVPYFGDTFATGLRWLVPIWFIFTVLLTIILAARWANKKIRS